MKIANLACVALLSVIGVGARAQHQTFTVDVGASTVKMELSGTGHSTEGTFHVEKGSVSFDFAPGPMSGTVLVNAGSGNTGNASRDKKMANEVLEASKFAEIAFAPTSYSGTLSPTGDSTIEVTGTFTLHGVAHPLTVSMQVHIRDKKLTAHTNFAIPYVQWGLKDPSIMFLKVAKEVKIDLTISGVLQ